MNSSFLSSSNDDLSKTLAVQMRRMQEKEAQQRASSLHLPYLSMQGFPLDLNVLGLFSEEEARQAESLPVYRDVHDLRIATKNPDNAFLKQKLTELEAKFKVSLFFISDPGFADTLKFYGKVVKPKAKSQQLVKLDAGVDYVKRLKELADSEIQKDVNASDLLADITGGALALKASDIHIEPEEKITKLRFRIDGVLQDVLHIIPAQRKPLTSRIKVVSKLKLNVENLPQDGRFSFYSGEQTIDVRVSILPSGYGEALVLRLLGTGATNLKLDQLGLKGRSYEVIRHQLDQPNGMIITTGPTGSGKTTTLYAFLNELNEPGVKIITLEDPIEYKLAGVQQTPIDYHVDFSFAKGLRAILRQDPDIVMVGEIRDTETAEIAIQAAQTGHLVLSTLHTNDAPSAVTRLIDMGIEPFLLSSTLLGVLGQRLIRMSCPSCGGKGCSSCGESGYSEIGRASCRERVSSPV